MVQSPTTLAGRPKLRGRRLAFVLALCLPVTLGAGISTASAATPVQAATLTPVNVPGTSPMIASAVPLADFGYTESEFYATGEATRYRLGTNPLATAQVIDSGWDYKTRVLVRAPRPEDFNGTLIVEWANVTLGQDMDFAWAESHEYLLREGYAFATVSAQKVGVDRLKTWSPERYGSLSVDASNVDPAGGLVDARNDPLSFDIYSQISQALQQNAGAVEPLPGLDVSRMIALGESQSAGRLTTYYNQIQPLTELFDGFVYLDRAGQLRADQSTPAISVNSEAIGFDRVSPTSSEFVRVWDVAGATHASYYGAQYVDAVVLRDRSLMEGGQTASFTQVIEPCAVNPIWSTVDVGLALNAAIDSVNEWIVSGRPAAPSTYFARDAQGLVLRDAQGRVIGGLQLPQFTVPTDQIGAVNTGSGFCRLVGWHRDYSASQLKAMYRNHGGYVSKVTAAAHELVQQGYLLRYDSQQQTREAAQSDVAR